MSTMTLETCPFCGTDDHETSPWRSGRYHESWICNCGNPSCGVRIEAPTPEDAVARWNRRAHLAQPAQAVGVGAIRDVIEQMRKASAQRAMPPHYEAGCYMAWIDDLTRALSGEKAGPVDGWISIEERRPERNKPAIYWHKSEFGGFATIADEWRDEHHLQYATHWMPYVAPTSPRRTRRGDES